MTPSELRHLLEEALQHGKVYIHVDTRVAGVVVPGTLLDRARVPLVIAWRYPGIDLQISDPGVDATLRFKGDPFRCHVPWSALLAIVGGAPQGALVSTQPELRVLSGDVESLSEADPATRAAGKGKLRLVTEDD
jgi:hypothetical protein